MNALLYNGPAAWQSRVRMEADYHKHHDALWAFLLASSEATRL